MQSIEEQLRDVAELNRSTRTSDAESKLQRLIVKLPLHELLKSEHAIRQVIEKFLPKRRKALAAALEAALATRPVSSAKGAGAGRPPQALKPRREELLSLATTASIGQLETQDVLQTREHNEPERLPMLSEQIAVMRAGIAHELQAQAVDRLVRIALHLAGQETDGSVGALSVLASAELSTNQRREVGACFAIAMGSANWLYEHPEFRLAAFRLLDDCWQRDCYPAIGVQPSMQTHQKWDRIHDAVSSFTKQLAELRSALTSLTMFAAFRQEFRKLLNSAISRAILWPVVQREMISLRIDDVLSATAEYISASDFAVFEARRRALDVLHDYSARAKESQVQILSVDLAGVVDQLLILVERHFSNSNLSKPSHVTVKPAPKKYPLTVVGSECLVRVTVDCLGPGHAFDVEIEYLVSENLAAVTSKQYLGNLQPGRLVEGIVLPCHVLSESENAEVIGKVRWTNHNQESEELEFEFTLEGQPSGIDWNDLDTLDPYSLEPVTEERDLFGRTEILNQLTAKTTAQAVGSFFVFGQKRVGKTSLVRSLESRLRVSHSELQVVYLDGGDYVHPDAVQTIQRLGTRLCEEIKQRDRRLSTLPIPQFDGALSPIDGFLRAVLQIAPEFRVVFILDEFDELPVQIYRRGPIGDAFFLTLRSISGKPPFGFVLVGGEKMEFILSTQGDALNKFQPLRVDYFDRETHWSDFQDLVRRPTESWLEVSDDALVALYNASAGNPFFAKLLCDQLFRLVLQRRDAHVTPPEIAETVRRALANVGSNRFSHFWEDGIFEETGDKVEERSMARRHILLAVADGLRRGGIADAAELLKAALREDMKEDEVQAELASFERRQVLERVSGGFRCKVGLFDEWLRERGVQEIVTTFTDRTTSLRRREREERERISETDIKALSDTWGAYKGRGVGPESVRAWLDQCGDVLEQKLMFRILQNIRFYTTAQVRAKMAEAHGIVERQLARRQLPNRMEPGQRKRRDIIVSHLGGVAKSGVRYGQLYADENGIVSDSVIERDRLGLALSTLGRLNALVLVDDFIGSGQSAIETFRELSESDRQQFRRDDLVVVYAVVCGLESGRAKLEAALAEMELPVHVHLCDQLTEADRCFADNSRVFPDADERKRACDVARALGVRLVKNAPLGYADCQTLVVFDTNCPNNTLPILWAERDDWKPLFRRT